MGDPKRIRKKYNTPRKPFDKDRITNELQLIGKYGLRNMKSVWKHSTMLGKFRGNARHLLSLDEEHRKIGEDELLGRLQRLGLLSSKATLDDVLSLQIEDILERRLQTLVFKKGMACSPYHARQMIVHGHVVLGDRVVDAPSHLVNLNEEKSLAYAPDSPFTKTTHKALPSNVYKSAKQAEAKKAEMQKGKRPVPQKGKRVDIDREVKPAVAVKKATAKELIEEETADVDVIALAIDDSNKQEENSADKKAAPKKE